MSQVAPNNFQSRVVNMLFNNGPSFTLLGLAVAFFYSENVKKEGQISELQEGQKQIIIEQRNMLLEKVTENSNVLTQVVETNEEVQRALYQFRPMSKYKRL